MTSTADNLIPNKDKWEFDKDVTDVFAAMLENFNLNSISFCSTRGTLKFY